MTISAWYSRCVLLLMVISICAYATAAGTVEFAVLAVPTVVALWKWSLRKAGRFLLPRWVVNVLLFAVVAYALMRSQVSVDVETIAQVVVLIQLIKIGDRRTARDDAQILCLTVFLAIAAMLDSNSIWTGIQLAVFLPLLILTVMLFQLNRGVQLAPLSADASMLRRVRRQLRATAALSTLGAIGFAFVVFIILPRGMGADVFGRWGGSVARRETAFSSTVTLGQKGVISQSPTVVLDLAVRDEQGSNLGGIDIVQYLRGAVLTEYVGSGRWSPPQQVARVDSQLGPGLQPYRRGNAMIPVVVQSVSMRNSPGDQKWMHLFALWRPVEVQFGRLGDFATDPFTQVLKRRAASGPFEYTVTSSLTDPPQPEEPWRRPPAVASERIRELAQRIVRDAGMEPDPAVRPREEDARAARVIQEYLRMNFGYTLEQESPPEGEDPVDFFLFTRKRGHCEYFASAMTLMCWSVGINARMITGYLATEYSQTTGAYVVRESNAHAWVEAESAEHKWRRFDPTPPDDLARIHRPSMGVLGRIRHILDAVEYAWNSSIVGFDEQARRQLLGPEHSDQSGWLSGIDRMSQRIRLGGPRLVLRALINGFLVFGAVFAIGAVVRVLLRFVRLPGGMKRTTIRRGRPLRLPGYYRDLLKWLSRHGMRKPEWRPPLEHARLIRAIDADLGESVGHVVEDLYRERFGGRELTTQRRAEIDRMLRRLSPPAQRP